MDDLLLASPAHGDSWRGTKALLALLSTAGYKVSRKKAQICRQEVKYVGSVISKGPWALGHERKQPICSIPWPNTKKEVREFLGAAGFCQIWIPGFSEIAKALFKAIAGSGKDPLEWGAEQEKAFKEIKTLLTRAPKLGLPGGTRAFNLFVCEKIPLHWGSSCKQLGMAAPSRIPVQMTGPSGRGWPPCLQAVPATVVLVREADKLTL